jgi:tRNA dimethylallyltransferase
VISWQCLIPEYQQVKFLVVVGPTASGKSALAMQLAQAFNGSIVCCDSVQLYRGFDIGSAKPSIAEQRLVPHYLYDALSWDQPCDAASYAAMAKQAIKYIREAGQLPIVVGGTGLYLRALLGDAWDDDVPSDEELRKKLNSRSSEDLFAELLRIDPRRAGQLHQNDRFRVVRALEINILTGHPVPSVSRAEPVQRSHLAVFLNPPRALLHERINQRTHKMLAAGVVQEVRRLISQGVDPFCKPMQAIGYKQVVAMIQGDLDDMNLEDEIATATRQYAKRQVTWFKKVPVDAVIEDLSDANELLKLIGSKI